MQSSLREKTLSGLLWQFLQRIIGQIFSFAVTVVLARLLMPEDYGVVALASMFNVLVGIFISGSMDAALIQKKDADELDYNTVFFSSFFMSFVIYAVVFFGAPFFARLYHNEQITPIMRVLALTMPIGALTMVQNAIVKRNLEFKKLFKATFFCNVFSAIIGIVMAYKGFGPWALVTQSLMGNLSNSFILFFYVKWTPSLSFSWERFKSLFSFAWKKTATTFIGTLCGQLKGYLIAGKYTTSDLAYYNRGDSLPTMVGDNLYGAIDAVVFPVLSKVNDDYNAVKRGMQRMMMTGSYIVVPVFFGLAAVSDSVVKIVYGPNWLPVIPYMQVACISSSIGVLSGSNLQAMTAIGKTGDLLKVEIYKKPIMIAFLTVAVFISPIAIAIAMLLYGFVGFYFNTLPNKKHLCYPILEQLNDVKAGFLIGGVMALIVYVVGLYLLNPVLSLFVQIPLGVTVYVGLSEMFKPKAYVMTKGILLDYFFKRKSSE